MSSAPRGLAPREGLELGLMKMGRTGPLLSHPTSRKQASLGTPVPRTPTLIDPLLLSKFSILYLKKFFLKVMPLILMKI